MKAVARILTTNLIVVLLLVGRFSCHPARQQIIQLFIAGLDVEGRCYDSWGECSHLASKQCPDDAAGRNSCSVSGPFLSRVERLAFFVALFAGVMSDRTKTTVSESVVTERFPSCNVRVLSAN